MSILTVVQSKSSNDFKAATSYKSATFAAPCTVGNSVMICITALAAELPFVVEPEAWNGTAAVSIGVPVASDTSIAGMTRYWYKLDNITSAITSIRYKVNASSGSTQQASTIYEIGNTGGAALTLRVDQKTSKTFASSFSENFTTVSANELLLVNLRTSLSNPTTAATAPVYVVTHGNGNVDDLYQADMGASGEKSVAWTTTTAPSMNVWITTFSNTGTTPTVSTVTGNTVTEGTVLRFTGTLSGATVATSDYAVSFGGTAVAGTDYDSNLANATFSTGASYVNGIGIRLLTGYSGFTCDVPTVDNALDQADRTLILTVGGVASTGGIILDNDAPPVVTFSDGVESFGVVTCVATLGAVSGKDVTFDVSTANGSKTAGTHYTAIVAQTVTIPAGSLTAAITVNTL